MGYVTTNTHSSPSPSSCQGKLLHGCWADRHFEQSSTGRSDGRQHAFWDYIQPPTQQMCWVICFFLGGGKLSGVCQLSGIQLSPEWEPWLCCPLSLLLSSPVLVHASKYLWAVVEGLLSLVGGRKTNWDVRWVYRHEDDVWFQISLGDVWVYVCVKASTAAPPHLRSTQLQEL